MQALATVFGAGFAVLVSLSLGTLLLRKDCPDPGIRLVTGAAILSALVFALCAAGLATPVWFAILGTAVLVWGGLSERPRLRRPTVRPRLLLLLAPFFILYLSNAMAPEISFDGSHYHLSLVGRYLREHGFHAITDNLYASLSQAVEMLYLFAFAFGKHSAAAVVHLAFLVALAWQIWSYARRAGFPLAGACAAILVFASPMAGVDGSSAYIDVAVAATAFTLFYLLQLWDSGRSTRLLIAIGLAAGFACAAKYTAFLAVPYAIGFVAWKSRRVREPAVAALCAALLIGPWMAKDWIFVRNPVAPFANGLFPNPYVTVAFEREYRQRMAHFEIPSRWEVPLEITTYGSLGGLLGPVFLLAPLALGALRFRAGRQLLLAALVFGATYCTNVSTRFLIPPLPFVALALAMALASVPQVAVAVVVLHAALSWPTVVRRYCHADAWRLDKVTYREALRIKPEDGFLHSNLPLYDATRMLDRLTPPGATIFVHTPIPEAYTSRHVQVAYQSAANNVSWGVLWAGFVPERQPTWRLHFPFPRTTLGAFRLVQTATAGDQWFIHELRLFDGSRELPRDLWRATAHPYPWGIEAALDGRLSSFWQCGDTAHPGQFVQVDLGAPTAADAVIVETAPGQPGIRLRLEGQDPAGRWTPLTATPQVEDLPPPYLRRAAADELRRRGIDYLLLFDGEFGADDLRVNAGAWGVRQVGEYKGARLYQLP